MPTRVLGVDAAAKLGWVGVVLDDGGFAGARTGGLRDLVRWAKPVEVIGVDIPIGHVPNRTRRADDEARHFVGPRRSSVFPAPPAEVLRAASYAVANELLVSEGRPMLSRQAWALVPKIVEAAELAKDDGRVFEVHPEVSFCKLAGSHLPWSKKSWNGLARRRQLLARAGIVLPDEIVDIGGTVADDLLDAAAVAWTARRIAAGTSETLPAEPEEHGGRQVAIWV